MKRPRLIPALLAALLCTSSALAAPAQAASSCDASQRHQFDFALGDWTVVDAAGQTDGTNHITSELGGCVVQEHWLGTDGELGSSFYSYMPYIDRWQSTWIDSEGRTILLRGGMQGTSLVIQGDRVTRTGSVATDRITWTPIAGGKVRQHIQSSLDGGRTWREIFDGYYARTVKTSQRS